MLSRRVRPPVGQSLYSREEKRQIVAEIRRRQQEEGQTVKSLAEEFGISDKSYWSWARSLRHSPRLVPVAIVPDPPAGPALPRPEPRGTSKGVLVTPQGYRVEGLAVGELAQLLRTLG